MKEIIDILQSSLELTITKADDNRISAKNSLFYCNIDVSRENGETRYNMAIGLRYDLINTRCPRKVFRKSYKTKDSLISFLTTRKDTVYKNLLKYAASDLRNFRENWDNSRMHITEINYDPALLEGEKLHSYNAKKTPKLMDILTEGAKKEKKDLEQYLEDLFGKLCPILFFFGTFIPEPNRTSLPRNEELIGYHILDNGFEFYGAYGAIEYSPDYFCALYYDGERLRVYVPPYGNTYNTDTNSPFTNDYALKSQEKVIELYKRCPRYAAFGDEIYESRGAIWAGYMLYHGYAVGNYDELEDIVWYCDLQPNPDNILYDIKNRFIIDEE